MQFAFTSADGSVFECALAFEDGEFANIDFHDLGCRDVPLHLSFRYRRQVMVFNQFIDDAWGQERPVPVSMGPSDTTVRVEFFLNVATVVVNGVRVGQYELPEATDGTDFPVHFVSYNGGAGKPRLSGDAWESRAARGILQRDEAFLLGGWGFDPGTEEQELKIELSGTGRELPLAVLPEPDHARDQRAPTDRIGVVALVPGWVWQDRDPAEEALSFQLKANGRDCGAPVTLEKDEIAASIEAICRNGPDGNSLELLSALEHVRYGEMLPRLSHDACSVLREAARRFRVSSFSPPLPETAHKMPPRISAPSGRPGPDPDAGNADFHASDQKAAEWPELPPVQQANKEIAAAMLDVAPEDMASVIRSFDVGEMSERENREFLLSLSGRFCWEDRFDDLFEVATEKSLQDMTPGHEDWTLVLALPFLYRQRRGSELAKSLEGLPTFFGWADHSALRWVLKRIIEERPAFVTEPQREEIVSNFLLYLQRFDGDYFSVLPSEELIAICVSLIEHLDSFAEERQDEIAEAIAGLYATSVRFWDGIEGAQIEGRLAETPRPVREGLQRFRTMQEAVEADEPAIAIEALPAQGSDVSRLRRELATAAQMRGTPAVAALELAQRDTKEGSEEADSALLRHLAFPSECPDQPDFAKASRRAIRRRTPFVPRSLHVEQQVEASQSAQALLLKPVEVQSDRSALLDAFFASCAILSSWRDEYLGQALAISLLTGSLTNRDHALSEEIPSRLNELLEPLEEIEREGLSAAPAVINALWGLRQAPGVERSDAARAVFETFAPELDNLPPDGPGGPDALVPKTGLAAFYGVLVVVYSCQRNQPSRLSVLRQTWLSDLEARGIPYVVVVGDGDGTRSGDTVSLDVADSYEALPKKTLAMAEWAIQKSGFSHIYKIDDDCYMDVDQAIGSLSYRKYAYYGRRILRNQGETDRVWHHSRGAVGDAKLEIDKSSEPSEYADGSTGYVLNRRALQDLVDTSNTRHGAWLKLASFMEDKLVGDTLALTGIQVANRDYNACILRRSHAAGLPVLRYENSFLPSVLAPAPVAHLDSQRLQKVAESIKPQAVLRPKRIWPGYRTARLGMNNLQVELVSDEQRLSAVNAADTCVVACMRNEMDMLPLFLEHYRGLGVDGFLIADNCSDDDTLEYLADQPDVAVFSAEANYNATQYGVAWQHALLSNLRMNRWSIVADADEFLVLPDGVDTFEQLLALDEFRGADCARVFMLDLYPQGDLKDAMLASASPFDELTHCDRDPFIYGWNSGTYYNAPAWTSAVRHRLMKGSRQFLFVAQKYPLLRYKPWMRITDGIHFAAEVDVAKIDLVFAHFKYHAAFHERARIETERGQHFNNAEEYRKYLALMAEGRDRIFDPEVSVPWRECDWVKRTLAVPASLRRTAAAE